MNALRKIKYADRTSVTLRIRQRKNGQRVYDALIRGVDVPNGQIQKSTNVICDGSALQRKAALHVADQLRAQFEAGLYYDEDDDLKEDMDYAAFCQMWLDVRANNMEAGEIRPNTYRNYCDIMRSIIPYFSRNKTTIRKLRKAEIMKYQQYELDKGTSPKQLRRKLDVMGQTLKYAIYEDYITTNPMDRIKKPAKGKPVEKEWYTADQLNALLRCVHGSEIETVVILGAYLGLRREEIMGLEWDQVDLQRGYISIRQVLTEPDDSLLEIWETKSEKSRRKLKINDDLCQYLAELKKKQKNNKKICGSSYSDTLMITARKINRAGKYEYFSYEADFVYRQADGTIKKPRNVSAAFSRMIKRNNLPHLTLHGLRHSLQSSLEQAGESASTCSRIIGDEIATLSIYTHSDQIKADNAVLEHQGKLRIK